MESETELIFAVAPNHDFYWGCIYSIEFEKMVVHNPFWRVNFRIYGGFTPRFGAPDYKNLKYTLEYYYVLRCWALLWAYNWKVLRLFFWVIASAKTWKGIFLHDMCGKTRAKSLVFSLYARVKNKYVLHRNCDPKSWF